MLPILVKKGMLHADITRAIHGFQLYITPRSFPVLRDIKRPLEFQVLVIIVIDELGHSFIMASCHYSGWGFVRCDYHALSKSCTKFFRTTYISFRKRACPRCLGHSFPTNPMSSCSNPGIGDSRALTNISSSLPTLIPFLFTIWRYFSPLSTSCWTLN